MKKRKNLFSLLFSFMLILCISAGAASVNVYAEDSTGNNSSGSSSSQFDFSKMTENMGDMGSMGDMGDFDFSKITDMFSNFGKTSNQNNQADPVIILKPMRIKKNYFTLTWNKVKGATKYVVYAGNCGDALRKVETLSPENTLVKIKKVAGKKLRPNTCQKFYIAAFGKNDSGNTVRYASPIIHLLTKNSNKFGSFKRIKVTSKTKLTLEKNKTSTIKLKLVPEKKKKIMKHRKVVFLSSDTNVAKVEKTSGKITAVGTGKCTVYCVTVNGLVAKVSVTVK